ncbi:YwdI family protein [Bacillus haynesii]|uniref:YwdI family protein n=1 Tax=Bacillus haynesii TaxID=1925021 RepID=UPI002DBA8005|nr:YwdI family protein [Bacillus haynesii]MEC1471185.1 YwdI family protein [Bacillus haynesii]MEC1483820.1 YwdI family protein [Bacillus haynesii]
MNIHISSLLQKMEDELKKAKECTQENELKMHIAVIRSLCDVIVEPQQRPSVQSSPTANKPSSDQLMLEKMMGSAGAEQYKKQEKQKHEDDGNGDSIFDF